MTAPGADTSPSGAVDARPAGDRAVVVLAWLAATLAVMLGAVGLGDASLWLDETFSVFDARRELVDILAMRGEAYGGAHHPGGYFLLLRGAIAICGTDEVCVRAPSVLANAGVAAIVVVLAARMVGRWPAAVAGVVWATMPYAIKYGQQARQYTLLALVAAGALLVLVRVLGHESVARGRAPDRAFVGLGLLAAAGLWLHLFALPFLATLAGLTAALVLVARDRSALPTLRQWAIATGVASIAAAPLLPGLWRVWVTDGGGQLQSSAGPVENARELLVDLWTFGLDTPWVPAVCACALLRPTWRARGQMIGLAVLAVAPLSVVLVRNPEHFVALRYFMPSLVPVALLFAAGVAGIVEAARYAVRRLAPRAGAWAGPAIAVVVLAVPALRLGQANVAGLRKQWATAGFEPWRGVAEAIRGAALDGDVAVYVPLELVRFPFEVYTLPIASHGPQDLDAVLHERPTGVFVVTSHIDRAERIAERREVLRRLAAARYVRSELDGVPRQRAIEVLLYRPR